MIIHMSGLKPVEDIDSKDFADFVSSSLLCTLSRWMHWEHNVMWKIVVSLVRKRDIKRQTSREIKKESGRKKKKRQTKKKKKTLT